MESGFVVHIGLDDVGFSGHRLHKLDLFPQAQINRTEALIDGVTGEGSLDSEYKN